LFTAGLRLSIAATVTTAESTLWSSGTARAAKAARSPRSASTETAKAAGIQHRRPQRGAFQLLALLGLERRSDRCKRPGAQHGDFRLELRDGIGLHADRTFLVFFREHGVQQFLLRAAEFFLQLAEFLAFLLRRFAIKLALFFVEPKADGRKPALESSSVAPLKVPIATPTFWSANLRRSAGLPSRRRHGSCGRRRGRGRRVRGQEGGRAGQVDGEQHGGAKRKIQRIVFHDVLTPMFSFRFAAKSIRLAARSVA
jgi:hypothetical protein